MRGDIDGQYDNLDFRINMLYDAMYNENSTTQYMIKPIVKNDIQLINIKEPSEFNYSHVFDGKFNFLGKLTGTIPPNY